MVELHEFFVEGGNQERSHVLLHITEPSTAAERAKGYFFAVCEINNGTLEQIEYLQQLIDSLESGYYETADTPEKDAMEIALEDINRRSHQLLRKQTAVINCLVGTLRSEIVSLSAHGQPIALLLYKREGELATMNILADEENKNASADQLFSAVLQGKLNRGDSIYFSTPHVADVITQDRLKKLLAGRSARESAGHIQKVLKSVHHELSYGGILMRLLPAAEMPKTGKLPLHLQRDANESMRVLQQQERRSTSVLSPSLWQKLKQTVKTRPPDQRARAAELPPKPAPENNYRPRPERADGSFFALTLITLGRALVAGSLGLWRLIKQAVLLIGRGVAALFLIITNKGGQRELVIQSVRAAIANKKQAIRNLPLLSRALFGLTLILGLVFISSLGWFRWREQRLAKLETYHNQVQAIVDKKSAAEASLIYNDEAKAFTLLQEATALLETLPVNNKERKEQKEILTHEVDVSLMKLRKINVVAPELVVDLGAAQGAVQTARLAALGEELFAYGENDPRLYRIDPTSKKITPVAHDNLPHLVAATTPKEEDAIVFSTRDRQLAEYQKSSGAIVSRTIDLLPEANIGALFIYSQRLYTIDTARSQISKHARTQTGYDRGTRWLKDDENIDLANAVSLAIDGDLFVLKANGEILKLTAGRKQEFAITGLDPALKAPTELWTYNDVTNIYILEPSQKRVVALDKNGKLLAQYTASEWQSPTGMVVREEKGEVYILDENKIYKFNLN